MKIPSLSVLCLLAASCVRVTPPAPAWNHADPPICCESFGYGALMEKCCSDYAWTTAAECTVPPGMTGGGREIVEDSFCPAPAPR